MQSVTKYFALFMSLIYLMLGAAFIAGSPFFSKIPRNYTIAMGAIMIIYGLFRGYRTYQKYFSGNEG